MRRHHDSCPLCDGRGYVDPPLGLPGLGDGPELCPRCEREGAAEAGARAEARSRPDAVSGIANREVIVGIAIVLAVLLLGLLLVWSVGREY
jgi:hypothetical protein